MSYPTLARCFNGVQTQVAAPYSAGSGVLTVAALPAAVVLQPGEWLRVTTLRGGVVLSILAVGAVTGSNLRVDAAIEGTTDVNLVVGDNVRMYLTAGAMSDIHSTLYGLLAPFSPINAGQIVYDDGTGFGAVDPQHFFYDAATHTLHVDHVNVVGGPAASPGTATGTDAAVINAIVTILRAAGLCA